MHKYYALALCKSLWQPLSRETGAYDWGPLSMAVREIQ